MFQPLLEAGLRGTMHRFVKPVLSRAFPLSVQRRYTREAYRTSYPPKDVSFAWEDLGDVPVLRASPDAGAVRRFEAALEAAGYDTSVACDTFTRATVVTFDSDH